MADTSEKPHLLRQAGLPPALADALAEHFQDATDESDLQPGESEATFLPKPLPGG